MHAPPAGLQDDSPTLSLSAAADSAYERALAFWFGLVNYEQRSPNPDELNLDRMRKLLQVLGNPQERLRIVHIAGSKGKGSTSAMLAAVLRAAGYRTGLFTSPHLTSLEERFQVNGQQITRAELTALLVDVQRAARELQEQHRADDAGTRVTFFEVATAIGLLHFVRRRVDVAVLEVGLGGRFDSTNVCVPDVAVITSISFDHTKQLGNRLASIAREKAGIIKPGRPVVSGVTAPEARDVIQRIAAERKAPLRQLGTHFHYGYEPGNVDAADGRRDRPARVRVTTPCWVGPWLEVGLLGEHQAANAALVIACVDELRRQGRLIPENAVTRGLASVVWPARLEILGRRPLVVLDCAHNVASAQALVDTLKSSFPPARRLLVFASSNDKDVPGILRVLAPHFSHAFLTRYGNSPRAVRPEELTALLPKGTTLTSSEHATAAAALQAARAAARPEDLLCVTGSVFLAGELRPLLLGVGAPP